MMSCLTFPTCSVVRGPKGTPELRHTGIGGGVLEAFNFDGFQRGYPFSPGV